MTECRAMKPNKEFKKTDKSALIAYNILMFLTFQWKLD